MKDLISTIATVVLALCALIVSGLAVAKQIAPDKPKTPEPMLVENWRQIAAEGTPIGSQDGAVKIVLFSDFQCLYCARIARNLEKIREANSNTAAVVYRHYPLSTHVYAFGAAVASECAGAQGRFEAFHDLLFQQQDSIGVKAWPRFARDAGVADSTRFAECLHTVEFDQRIRRDMEVGKQLGVAGTPAVVVNGRMHVGYLSVERLQQMVDDALQASRG